MTRPTKEQGLLALLASTVSLLTGLVTLWAFTERVFAGEVQEQVRKELAPVITIQKILLQSDVDSRRLGIAAMEFKRDSCQEAGCWTVRDAQDLTKARSELAAREQALRALQ